jgi:hypothetical protein
MYATTDISNALKQANVSFDRVRKHGEDGFKINKVEDTDAASKVLQGLEGSSIEVNENVITLTFAPAADNTEAGKQEGTEAAERTKNPEYDVVFDMAIQALSSGDTLTEWKAGRKVRMMQTIRKLYEDKFEKQGRNVVFTGDVKDIDKAHVLSNLGLKTERSLPKSEAATA